MDLSRFKHKVEQYVRYNDLDTQGHVNNAKYLIYLEEARIAYFEDVLDFNKTSLDFQVVVGTINVRYVAPIYYGDHVELYTRCSRIGEKSMDFQTVVVKSSEKEPNKKILAAESTVTLVSYDENSKSAVKHNPSTIELLMRFDNVC